MPALRVKYSGYKYLDQVAQLLFQAFVFPHAVKIRIRLQNMKMRIHRLLLVLILIAQSHVLYGLPLAGQCFYIPVLHRIKTVFFNHLKQPDRIFQSLAVTGGAGILTQSVNSKAQGINLFLGIRRCTVGIQLPEYAAILLVIKRNPADNVWRV